MIFLIHNVTLHELSFDHERSFPLDDAPDANCMLDNGRGEYFATANTAVSGNRGLALSPEHPSSYLCRREIIFSEKWDKICYTLIY